MWLISPWNVAHVTKKMNFYFNLNYVKFKLLQVGGGYYIGQNSVRCFCSSLTLFSICKVSQNLWGRWGIKGLKTTINKNCDAVYNWEIIHSSSKQTSSWVLVYTKWLSNGFPWRNPVLARGWDMNIRNWDSRWKWSVGNRSWEFRGEVEIGGGRGEGGIMAFELG